MPKKEQTIKLNNLDKETALAISYQAMKNLEWLVQFAGEEKLMGNTPQKWSDKGQQIMIETDGVNLTVSSEMVNGESFDMSGKNKKNIEIFLAAFEAAQNSTDTSTIEQNKEALAELRAVTLKAAEQEAAEAEEVNKAMHLSGSNLYATYTIIAVNVLVFVLMALNGAGIFEPNGIVHMKWGSNVTNLTLSGDWWRLITNVFIHFGIIHLLMNMYCLYTVGIYLEPMLGKLKYITAYLCTGILASVVSIWWHKEGVNSAGASGAIFGMYGLFLALLTTNLIPKKVRNALLQSIGIFIFYNLAYGMKSGVDNSAHIGGLISGFVIGYIYAFGIKKEKDEQPLTWILPVVIIATLAIGYEYLQMNKVFAADRKAQLTYIDAAQYKDYEKFAAVLNNFYELEQKAIAPLEDSMLTNSELKSQIDSVSYPSWRQAETDLTTTKNFDISPAIHKKVDIFLEYISLRKNELDIYNKFIETGDRDKWVNDLNIVRDKINTVLSSAK